MIHDVAGKGVNKLHRASTSGVTLSRNLIIIIHSRLWKSSTRGEAEELTEDHDEKERPPMMRNFGSIRKRYNRRVLEIQGWGGGVQFCR